MNKKEIIEIRSILRTLLKQITEVKTNQRVLKETVEAWVPDMAEMKRSISNVEIVTVETSKRVDRIHQSMISTVSKQGAEITKLKLVRDAGPKDSASGNGRRTPRKN